MSTLAVSQSRSRPQRGIAFVLLAMLAASANDMLVKRLSADYPLHEIVFVRSVIAVTFSLVLLQFEGGWRSLRTDRPWLHLLRCTLLVGMNLTFFTAVAALPLAEATALFFVMPLFITILSVPLLGERVGPWRIGAVLVGLAGVVIMLRPGAGEIAVSRPMLLLPVLAALFYALMQILTRRLGETSKASAMAIYVQCTFILISLGFFLIAGDGRFAAGSSNQSMQFLLGAWRWPQPGDRLLFAALGAASGVLTYSLAQAYRSAEPATIAPFEYAGLPLAMFWGWAVWGHLPGPSASAGIVLIAGAGLLVLLRERAKLRPTTAWHSRR